MKTIREVSFFRRKGCRLVPVLATVLSLSAIDDACAAKPAAKANAAPAVEDFGPASYISASTAYRWGSVYGRPTGKVDNPCKMDLERHTIEFQSLCKRYSFVIECDEAPDLMDWAKKRLKPVVEEWYARLADELGGTKGYAPYQRVTYRLKAEMNVPGYCVGRRICLKISWIRKNQDNVALGMVIHETWHSLQHYRAKKPGWITEALADWVRYFHYQQFGFPDGLRKLRVNPRTARADSKYGKGAAFLEWCRHKYGTRFTHDLIDALRTGAFDDAKWWRLRTGRTFAQMAAEWNSGVQGIEVMSYNIRADVDKGEYAWSNRLEQVLSVLDLNRPDIVALQEASFSQIRDIRPHFDGWSAVGVGSRGGGAGEMNAILWDRNKLDKIDSGVFWLSNTPSKPGSRSWGADRPATCGWAKFRRKDGGRELFVFNTKFDRKAMSARYSSAVLLKKKISEIAGRAPVIVMGDLGDEIGSSPVVEVARNLQEARGAAGSEVEGPEETFNGYGKLQPRRCSYIFASGEFKVSSFQTCDDRPDDKYPSCYDPIAARLEFK